MTWTMDSELEPRASKFSNTLEAHKMYDKITILMRVPGTVKYIRTQKSRDFQSIPSNGPSNEFARIKTIMSKRHIKRQLHW